MDRKKVSIGLSGIGGVLDIFIGLPSLYGLGFLTWGTSRSLEHFIGIIFLPSGILAFVGAFIEFKSLIIGGLLCLIAGISTIILPIIINYYYFNVIIYSELSLIYFPTLFIIVGGILGILEWRLLVKARKRN
ncbi:MAG: hypothetical protein ACFE9N_02885 [Promethearchaeota archaeon]